MKALNLTGKRFGRLLVERRVGSSRHGKSLWLCHCDCGGTASPDARSLVAGVTSSCGCLRREIARENGAAFDGQANVRHGMAGQPEYNAWKTMRQRCSDRATGKDRELYFERGIRVCERWSTFDMFIADMGLRPSPKHSIDRIDNDRGYEPANCRWATAIEQANNRRPRRRSA